MFCRELNQVKTAGIETAQKEINIQNMEKNICKGICGGMGEILFW